jgi:hypothetical protein
VAGALSEEPKQARGGRPDMAPPTSPRLARPGSRAVITSPHPRHPCEARPREWGGKPTRQAQPRPHTSAHPRVLPWWSSDVRRGCTHETEPDIRATGSPGDRHERRHSATSDARHRGQVQHDRPGAPVESSIEVSLHVLRRDLVQRAADQHQRDRRPEVADLELDLEAFLAHDVPIKDRQVRSHLFPTAFSTSASCGTWTRSGGS